jgi:iron complex transport system substrate-binding protein
MAVPAGAGVQRIVGISGYTVRPPHRARQEKPRVSAFLSAKIDKILALQPDCVFGFSDLQADIAAALIRMGVQVTVFNQRSVDGDFLHAVPGGGHGGAGRTRGRTLDAMQRACTRSSRCGRQFAAPPRVFFEEWDEPAHQRHPLGVGAGGYCRWGRLLPRAGLAVAGQGPHHCRPAGEIVRRNPDIIIGSWCGKKFRPEKVAARPGWENVPR